MNPGHRGPGALPVLLTLILASSPVYAIETSYQLGYRLEYQSNIRRTETNEKSEWINEIFARALATEDTTNLSMSLDATIRRRFYKENSFPDRTVADVTGDLLWTIRPERLTWTVTDYLRETVIDPRDADTPTNRQRTNTFTTGPDLLFRVGRRDRLTLSHRFIDNYQEVTDLDNQQNLSTLSWQHRLSPISLFSAVAEYDDIDYAADIYPDRTITNVFARYTLNRPVILFQLDGGTTRVRTVGRPETTGDLRRLRLEYQITANETLGLRLDDRVVEAGNIVDAALVPGDPLADGRFLTANVFREKRGVLDYTHGGPFSTLTASLYSTTRNYFLDATLDNQLNGGRLTFDYNVAATVTLTIGTDINRRFYPFDGREIDTDNYWLGATYLINPRLILNATLSTTSRDSTVAGDSYDNFSAVVGITYDI